MEFSRQESWSGLPFPTQGIFLTQGLNPRGLHLLHWQADSLPVVLPANLLSLKQATKPSREEVRSIYWEERSNLIAKDGGGGGE